MSLHLAKILLKEDILSFDQIRTAIEEQKRTGKGLGEVLISLAYIDEHQLVNFLSKEYGVPAVNLEELEIESVVLKLIPRKTAVEHGVIPVNRSGSTLIVAMADPSNILVIDELGFVTGCNIKPVVASERAIKSAIDKYYSLEDAAESKTGEYGGEKRSAIPHREEDEQETEEIIRELEEFKRKVKKVSDTSSEDSLVEEEKEELRLVSISTQEETIQQQDDVNSEARQDEEMVRLGSLPSQKESLERDRELDLEAKIQEIFGSSILFSNSGSLASREEESGSEVRQQEEERFNPSSIFTQVYESNQQQEEVVSRSGQEGEVLDLPEGASASISPESIEKEEKTQTTRESILVVDDSQIVQKIVSITLERRGYRVFVATNAIQALAKLNEVMPDLIFLDINLPYIDGYKLCKIIKGNELTKDIPVVMLLGKHGFFDKVRGQMAGATDYITKPFEASTILQVVEKYTKRVN
jgi:CheY-like chemotaxis protein